MRTSSWLFVVTTSIALASTVLTIGCGGTQDAPKTAAVKPGNMPDGASWDGVYYHPVWGHLHLVTDGANVSGRWKRADESAWGEMRGTVTGNVLRFEWQEHKVGMVGPAATQKGRGYFQYKRPPGENIDDRVEGEFGNGESEIGAGEWDAVKQRNMKPDPKSISGEADANVGSWK